MFCREIKPNFCLTFNACSTHMPSPFAACSTVPAPPPLAPRPALEEEAGNLEGEDDDHNEDDDQQEDAGAAPGVENRGGGEVGEVARWCLGD